METTDLMLYEEGQQLTEKARNMKGSIQTVKLLNCLDYVQAYELVNALGEIGRQYSVVNQDSDSLYNAVLACVSYPNEYDAKMLRKQIVVFAICNIEHVEKYLVQEGETECVESYLRNISKGLSIGDRRSLVLISLMWKVSISVVSPSGVDNIGDHDLDLEDVDIVLLFNGSTHYSGSTYVVDPPVRLRAKKDKIFVNTSFHLPKTKIKDEPDTKDDKPKDDKPKDDTPKDDTPKDDTLKDDNNNVIKHDNVNLTKDDNQVIDEDIPKDDESVLPKDDNQGNDESVLPKDDNQGNDEDIPKDDTPENNEGREFENKNVDEEKNETPHETDGVSFQDMFGPYSPISEASEKDVSQQVTRVETQASEETEENKEDVGESPSALVSAAIETPPPFKR